jgi:hypothetical protein
LLTSLANQTKPRFQESPPPEGKERKVSLSTSTSGGGDLSYFEKEFGLDADVSRVFVDIHRVSYLMEENDSGTLKDEKDVLKRSIYEAETAVDKLLRGGQYGAGINKDVESKSGCCIVAAYIYVYHFLRRIPYTSTIYDYLVMLLKEDIVNFADTIRQDFVREVLFWVFFVGASAGKGRPEESWFRKELAVSRQSLRISTWEVAKFVLKKVAWVEDWNEEVDAELFNGLEGLE